MSAALIVETARGWIGTPYLHQASLKGKGCDCLGLLTGVWRELGGPQLDIPAYSMGWGEATGAEVMVERMRPHLTEIAVAAMEPGDVAVFRMRMNCPAKHCGIVAERGGAVTVIHARARRAVAEEEMGRELTRRIAHVFRVPGDLQAQTPGDLQAQTPELF